MDNATLQLVLEQLNTLVTCQEEIENNVRAGQKELRKHMAIVFPAKFDSSLPYTNVVLNIIHCLRYIWLTQRLWN
jgi:hypothetical protein